MLVLQSLSVYDFIFPYRFFCHVTLIFKACQYPNFSVFTNDINEIESEQRLLEGTWKEISPFIQVTTNRIIHLVRFVNGRRKNLSLEAHQNNIIDINW